MLAKEPKANNVVFLRVYVTGQRRCVYAVHGDSFVCVYMHVLVYVCACVCMHVCIMLCVYSIVHLYTYASVANLGGDPREPRIPPFAWT